jgi:hypothetical protein
MSTKKECYKIWGAAVAQVSTAWNKRFGGGWCHEGAPWCDPVEEDRLARAVGRAIKRENVEGTKERVEAWKAHWRKLWVENVKRESK